MPCPINLIDEDPFSTYCRQQHYNPILTPPLFSPPSPPSTPLPAFTSPPTPTAASFPVPPCFVSPRCKWTFDVNPEGEAIQAPSSEAISPWSNTSELSSNSDSDGTDEATTPTSNGYYHPDSVEMGFLGDGGFGGPPPIRCDVKRKLSYTTLDSSPRVIASVPSLFPTFGDFLPTHFLDGDRTFDVDRAKSALGRALNDASSQVETSGLGLGLSFEDEQDRRRAAAARTQPAQEGFPFAPFGPSSPTSDSFTFHPSPSFRSASSITSSTNGHYFQDRHLTPLTPPCSRSSSRGPGASASPLPLTPPSSLRMNNVQLQCVPHPYSVGRTSPLFPSPPLARTEAYPLSPEDAELVARLHDGRIPTLEQLAPPEAVSASTGQTAQPIINTGNHGPMVKQTGDWNCGTCTFTNWRRRRICMKCFPFANDIGTALTIASQRPASAISSHTFPSPSSRPTFLHRPSLVPTAVPAVSPMMRSLSYSGPFGSSKTRDARAYSVGGGDHRTFFSRQPLPPLPFGTPPRLSTRQSVSWTDTYTTGFPEPGLRMAIPEHAPRRDQGFLVCSAVAL